MPNAEESAKALFFAALDDLDAGRNREAERGLRAALALVPDRVSALTNLSAALFRQNKFDEASAVAARAAALDENNSEGMVNLGCCLEKLGKIAEALACFDRAIALAPENAEAWLGRSSVLNLLFRPEDALTALDKVLGLDPGSEEALLGRGRIFAQQKKYDLAAEAFRAAANSTPKASTLAELASARMYMCDWNGIEDNWAALLAAAKASDDPPSPFFLLSIPSTPEQQLANARAYSARNFPPLNLGVRRHERYSHQRLRVAYVSPDFRKHAAAWLTAGLFEQHDRQQFEVIGISIGPADTSEIRSRVSGAFDRFLYVQSRSDAEIVQLLREMEVDIAVDLCGYTSFPRPRVLSYRPAAVQVNYLGYPGTLGAAHYDYIVADEIVIPAGERHNYSEAVVTLPHSYQVNDSKRHRATLRKSRLELGLPDHGFVFCSFNDSYKITPEAFDIWMRLLKRVDGSVLWLLESSALVRDNLRREAEHRGVSANRLAFAPRANHDEHIDRHLLADLFLDTVFCNGHTTTSDALWTGLPGVTCTGRTFAGRVGASLLRAANMPELITESLDEYEALALRLALDPELLSGIKRKLAVNIDVCPLFDTGRFTRHLESAYRVMADKERRGERPAAFSIEDIEE